MTKTAPNLRERIAELRIPHRRWTSHEYNQFITMGIIQPGERVELIDGEIVNRMPRDPLHLNGLDLVQKTLLNALSNQDCFVRMQSTVSLPEDSEPEPDASVLMGDQKRYYKRHARPDDVLLLVEVANSTLAYDRTVKAPLYARHGIQEYWIVNVPDNQVEVFRNPDEGFVEPTMILRSGDIFAPLAAPDISISVKDLLPGAEEAE